MLRNIYINVSHIKINTHTRKGYILLWNFLTLWWIEIMLVFFLIVDAFWIKKKSGYHKPKREIIKCVYSIYCK